MRCVFVPFAREGDIAREALCYREIRMFSKGLVMYSLNLNSQGLVVDLGFLSVITSDGSPRSHVS